MYCNKKNKILFIHNKKCAGRSIKIALKKSIGHVDMPKNSNHWSFNQCNYYFEDDLNDYLKISSVRNPWDRIVSYYYYEKAKNPELYFLKSFGTFCSNFNLKPLALKPQMCILDQYKIDFCLKVENINEDFDNLMKKLGVKKYPELKKQNHNTSRKRADYKDCYTTKTRKIIEDVFSWEINKFNYKF